MIVVNKSSQFKIDIITKTSQGKLPIGQAAKLLNKSRRTIERYLSSFRQTGVRFAIHKNTLRSPVNKTPHEKKLTIQKLIQEQYYDFNLTHLREKLASDYSIQIGKETLRKFSHQIHHVKKSRRRKRTIRKRRERMPSPGLLLQLDGSTHRWFGDKKSCLMAIIDDATSELHAEFFESETTLACMKLLKKVITKKGVFKTLYVDRAGIYGGAKRCHFSQVQRACEELGIEILYAHSPEGKGRIERAFGTIQDRLIPELRLEKIYDIDKANLYLEKTFIPGYWNKNAIVSSLGRSEYTPNLQDLNLDEILVHKEYRKIRNDHTFSFGNDLHFIESDLKSSIAKQEIEIRVFSPYLWKVFFANKELKISKVIQPTKGAVYSAEIQKKIDALKLAEKLNNVASAARMLGLSRQSIYKYRRIIKDKGPVGLKRTFNPNRRHKNRPSKKLENTVIDFSLENPHLGQAQVSRHLMKVLKLSISPGGVRNIWLRHRMETMELRLKKKKELSSLVA